MNERASRSIILLYMYLVRVITQDIICMKYVIISDKQIIKIKSLLVLTFFDFFTPH